VYVLELACFRAHPQHVAALLRRVGPLLRALRSRFPGLRKLEVARVGDGSWLQLGYWDSREAAQAAADGAFDLPEMSDWLAQVGEFAEAA
jgi:Antibiotic biosynthesis monooxygenase